MATPVQLTVELVGHTSFFAPRGDINWRPDEGITDLEAIVEYAGRTRFGALGTPGMGATEEQAHRISSEAFLHGVIEIGALELLEHATVTFAVSGLSFGAAHELLRHRHFHFSELSQRGEQPAVAAMVIPPAVEDRANLSRLMHRAVDGAREAYDTMLEELSTPQRDDENALLRLSQARQAARSVLPIAAETYLVMTGSLAAWRGFIAAEATRSADEEVRSLALQCLARLREVAPRLVDDFEVEKESLTGVETASSRFFAPR